MQNDAGRSASQWRSRVSVTADLRKEKERRSMGYLRQMSWEEEKRTVYHDLLTPHRSYAFVAKGTAHI
jgi:hypothetical protein